MNAVSLLACIVILWAFSTRSNGVLRSLAVRYSPPAALALPAAIALVPLYAAQVALVMLDSRLQGAASPYAWMRTLPMPVFDDRVAHHAGIANVGLALGALQTVAITIVVLRFRHAERAVHAGWIAAIAVALIGLSLASPTLSTTDPYEYAATGIIGMNAYAPRYGAFERTAYEPYQKLVPVRGVIYGPLWLAIDMAQTRIASTIGQKIEAIRITNVAFVAMLLALCWRVGLSRAALVGLIVNPTLWYYSVANPHAEVQGLVFLSLGYGFARRSNWWSAVAFVVAAGLVKLPFVVVGAAVLSPLAGAHRRVAAWFAASALVLLLSYVIPGPAYLAALLKFGVHRTAGHWYAGWLPVAFLIVCASCSLIVIRRKCFGAAWLYQQISPLAAPWYLFWGVPYALATGSLEAYAACLPLASSILDEVARREDGAICAVVAVGSILACDMSITALRQIRLRESPAQLRSRSRSPARSLRPYDEVAEARSR